MVSLILVNYHCMTKVKAAMDQYMEGLESLGLLGRIQVDPSQCLYRHTQEFQLIQVFNGNLPVTIQIIAIISRHVPF